ncbi:MAG: IS21 family transposase [Anaerolineae bacterium]
MMEVHEIVRQWLAGVPKKRVAARLGCDPKTVRRYVGAAEKLGLQPGRDADRLGEEMVAKLMAEVRPHPQRPRGDGWALCQKHRELIKDKLKDRVRLSKIRRLVRRRGDTIPYATLHRFATAELGYGRRAVTVPVADGEPGKEIQVDVGWVVSLEPDASGRRRRMRAWIFTPVLSRYRFVYPCMSETTESAIEACEAAWDFYDGVFEVIIPDNTSAIVTKADPLNPTINQSFLEYSQARGFYIDPARVRKPTDKARCERAVRDVRDDCFGGETITTLEQARDRALTWSSQEYGLRRHTTTGRMPKEHFETDERPRLAEAPTEPFDIPTWHEPKVGRDHFAAVAKSLYTLPTTYCGQRLRARADSRTVRFYDRGGRVVKVHPRVAPGKKSVDTTDFPDDKRPYAMRDVEYLGREAAKHGPAIGKYAQQLLAGPLPWTRMRQVYAVLSLVRKYGAERVEELCEMALAMDMLDVTRLRRMLEQALKPKTKPKPRAQVIPIARYLREPSQYALPLKQRNQDNDGGDQK